MSQVSSTALLCSADVDIAYTARRLVPTWLVRLLSRGGDGPKHQSSFISFSIASRLSIAFHSKPCTLDPAPGHYAVAMGCLQKVESQMGLQRKALKNHQSGNGDEHMLCKPLFMVSSRCCSVLLPKCFPTWRAGSIWHCNFAQPKYSTRMYLARWNSASS